MSASSLPPLVLTHIDDYLEGADKITFALVCKKWRKIVKNVNINASECELNFNSACNDQIGTGEDENRLVVGICCCDDHHTDSCYILREFFSLRGLDGFRLLNINDVTANHNLLSNALIKVLFGQAPENIETIEMECVDLSLVDIDAYIHVSRFQHITRLALVDCIFPDDLEEVVFVRNLIPLMGRLEIIEISGTSFFGDTLGIALSHYGTALQTVNMRRCRRITALTVFAFCHYVNESRQHPVTFDMRSTSFNLEYIYRSINGTKKVLDPSWTMTVTEIVGRTAAVIMKPDAPFFTIYL